MKIFNWIRNKRSGTEVSSKPSPEPKSYDEIMRHESQFSDWPNGLLTIGTFGTTNLKQSEKVSSIEDRTEEELRKLLGKQSSLTRPVEELLECLQEDEESERKEKHLQRTTSVAHRGGRDIRSSSKMRRKSLSFLIKKALLCKGGFAPTPSLKDPLPDPRLDHSTMEKILRAMLHKKIYPQRPAPTKYLDMPEVDSDEEKSKNNKWVKTDSEYIVLEI